MTRTSLKTHVLLMLVVFLTAGTPAFAQIDLGGNWAGRVHEDSQERSLGPDLVDYLGLPLNADGRARALRYSQSQLSLPERQCLYYAPHYLFFEPAGIKIWSETDPTSGRVVAWIINGIGDRSPITIWMDGRPHPSANALHDFGGFTTGVWEGNTLTTYTTHFKEGYLRRNGVPSSDAATLTMHLSRHEDLLTITGILDDPVYLTRPHIVSRSWQLNPRANFNPVGGLCTPEAEVASLQGDGVVPHYLPGENPFAAEMARRYNLPAQALLGGEETMYPEYRKRLKDAYVAPAVCVRYCCGWDAAFPNLATGIRCITDGTGKESGP